MAPLCLQPLSLSCDRSEAALGVLSEKVERFFVRLGRRVCACECVCLCAKHGLSPGHARACLKRLFCVVLAVSPKFSLPSQLFLFFGFVLFFSVCFFLFPGSSSCQATFQDTA